MSTQDIKNTASVFIYTGQVLGQIPEDIIYARSEYYVKKILNGAFFCSEYLRFVELHEGLRVIESGAFLLNRSLTRIKLPKTIEKIGAMAFNACYKLLTVEISSKIIIVGEKAFRNCRSLTNVAIPGNSKFPKDVFQGCTKLQKVFPDQHKLTGALKDRFVGLPVHELCYSQVYHPTVTTVYKLNREIVDKSTIKYCCFGSTPFHILAKSTKLNKPIWMLLMERYGEPRINELLDQWKKSPIHYLCESKEPQSTIFLKCVVQSNISNRLRSYTFYNWRIQLLNEIEAISETWKSAEKQEFIERIYDRITKVEMQEAISLLILCIWKVKIGVIPSGQQSDPRQRKICRITCGDYIIVTNILPFLG
jgi:hypothetical protein